jgi:hypothetical protein
VSRLVHLVTDYGPGDLAFAQVVQQLALTLPDAVLLSTRVGPCDTLAAGFCVAELVCGHGPPGRLVAHNVASRRDGDSDVGRFCAGRTHAGAIVVGPNAGWSWSFAVAQLSVLHHVDVPVGHAPELLVAAVTHVAAGHPHAVQDAVPHGAVPPVPVRVVAYVDCFGNLKTTISQPPAATGDRVQVRIGHVSATAMVTDRSNPAAREGELLLTPDDGEPRFLQLSLPGGSAADRFERPAAGSPIAVAPAERAG